jgi:site-specific DNA recombinase
MPRYNDSQRKRAQSHLERRWELPPGSHVWVYLRHSPGDNQTIDSQKSAMQVWCDEQGWIIDGWFIDEAVEGSREDRAQFQKMIFLARQDVKHVDGIALWSFSRFARSQLDAQFYKADLRKRGYVIVSKIDDIPNNEMAPVIEAFIDWKNQRFLEDLSADVRRGLEFIVDLGYWPGGVPPVGYVANDPVVIGRKRNGEPRIAHRLMKDPALAERVALAWQMKLDGNASYEQIDAATHLYSSRQHYSHFFSNLLYAGIFVYHGDRYPKNWEEGAVFCEPYVSLEDFLRVQANRVQRSFTVTSPRILSSDFLLSGLVVCGHCLEKGKRVTVTARVDKRRPDTSWYVCGVKLRQRGSDCDLPRVSCWLLEESIIDALLTTALTPEYLMQEIKEAQRLLDERRPQLETEIVCLERDVNEKEKGVRELLRLIQKTGMSPLLENEYQRANNEWLSASGRLAAMRKEFNEESAIHISEAEVREYVQDIRETLKSGEIHTRQALLRRFVRSITLYPDHAVLEYTYGLPTQTPFGHFGGVDSPSYGVPTVTRTPVYGSGGRRSIH